VIKAKQETVIRVARNTLGQIKNPFELPQWLPELKDKKILRKDFIAGLTVALVLIPQSMAYAQLAGLPAHYGLYASLLPPIIATIFGSSRQLATGPVAMVSLMTAAALEPLATMGSEAFVGYAVLLAFMVGLFQLMLGMFRLGVLLNFLSVSSMLPPSS
jgi:SulP family sulfate permease